MERGQRQNSDLRIVQNESKAESVEIEPSERSPGSSPSFRGKAGTMTGPQTVDTAHILTLDADVHMQLADSQVFTHSLRQSNQTNSKLNSYAQTDECEPLQKDQAASRTPPRQESEETGIIRLASQHPLEADSRKQTLELGQHRRDSDYSTQVVSRIRDPSAIVNFHKQKEQAERSRVHTGASAAHLTPEYGVREGPTPPSRAAQRVSTMAVDEYTLDRTGLNAARGRYQKRVEMKNRTAGLIKTKQFELVMPVPPLNTEERFVAKQLEKKEAALRKAAEQGQQEPPPA